MNSKAAIEAVIESANTHGGIIDLPPLSSILKKQPAAEALHKVPNNLLRQLTATLKAEEKATLQACGPRQSRCEPNIKRFETKHQRSKGTFSATQNAIGQA